MDPVTIAMLAAQVGSGIYGATRKNKSGATGGYDVVTMPQYSFTEPRLRLTSDYISQNIERMMRGEYPSWYDKAQPVMREGMMRGLNQSMYGRPGERTGAVQSAMDVGAQLGVGPKAAMSQTRKLYSDYLDKSSQIDEYLTGLGVDIMRSGEQTYLQGSMAMPKGPDAQIVGMPNMPYGQQGNPWLDFAGTIGSNIDWGKMFGQGIPQGATSYGGGDWGMSTPYIGPGLNNNQPVYMGPGGQLITGTSSQY